MSEPKVLIVEDERIIALDLERRLERCGYTVVGLESEGEAAIETARTKSPDIIIMDIMLSGSMDGIEASKHIKAELAIPVIFLTAYADEGTLERVKQAEPYGYILKPFNERELLTTIDIALYKDRTEKKLRSQEHLYSAILHSINDGIISVDASLRVSFMNAVAERIIGLADGEARGRKVTELLPSFEELAKQKELRQDENQRQGRSIGADRPYFFSEISLKNAKGDEFVVEGSMTRIRSGADEGYVIVLRDISEIKRMSERIDYQASHDNLTGLSNREDFSSQLDNTLKGSQSTGKLFALLVLDIDRFKVVNDSCGAFAGDELLRQVAVHIKESISREDISARINGDEFAVILMNCNSEESAHVATRLRESLEKQRFSWQENIFPITVSVGIVPIENPNIAPHDLLAAAEEACKLSKEEGGNKIIVFHAEDNAFKRRKGDMHWITEINHAIDEDRFILYDQPIVPLNAPSGKAPPKAEILLRLVQEDGSLVLPERFVPVAERYSLASALDRWVLTHAFKTYRGLRDRGAAMGSADIAVNLSGPSILDEDLIDTIIGEAETYGIEPIHICFEITETAAIQNLASASVFMKKLKDKGFFFALDDFGSGFSSLSYLRSLPVDYLKIDETFVRNIDESLISYAMVETINSVSHIMGIKTIAEFVKDKATLDKLQSIGVDYLQGYYIAEPSPFAEAQ